MNSLSDKLLDMDMMKSLQSKSSPQEAAELYRQNRRVEQVIEKSSIEKENTIEPHATEDLEKKEAKSGENIKLCKNKVCIL